MELVFVHGALVRDGEWWWRPTAELLAERTGVGSRSLLLPSCGETTAREQAGGLRADALALTELLDGLDDAVVVGHSYGGTVLAEVGAHRAVRHQVLISSYLPDVGEAQADLMSSEPDPVAVGDAGGGLLGVSGYDARSFGERFLHDTDEAVQRGGWERVTTQAVGAFTTPTTRAGWQDAQSTYLVCAEDRSTTPALQRRHAGRATHAVELPTGHHPFLSRPDLVLDQLVAVLASAGGV